MGLKEIDLVLPVDRRGVGVLPRHGEVVKDFPTVDGGLGLGDQLYAAHVLPVPVRGRVQGELGSLPGDGVVGVLVVGREVDVLLHGGAAVDVVLIGSYLVGPGPGV